MEPKKSPRANLNNFSTTFLLIGLVLMLFLSWQLIELKTYEKDIDVGTINLQGEEEEENIEVNIEEFTPPPPPKQVAPPEEIEVVEDEEDVKEDVIDTSETDDEEEIEEVENIDTEDVEEIEEEVIFAAIQNPPIYPGCEGKKGAALKKCTADKIRKFVAKHFDQTIAADLGLYGERVKIFTRFIIDKDGRVTNIEAKAAKYKDLEKEARRVLSKIPKMKPGQQRNRPVRVKYSLPIIFQVPDE